MTPFGLRGLVVGILRGERVTECSLTLLYRVSKVPNRNPLPTPPLMGLGFWTPA